MSVTVRAEGNGAILHIEVRDCFDFDASRSLLSQCGPVFGPNLRSVTVELVNVRTVRSCALGALLILSEHAGKIGVVLRLRDCPENIEYLFSAGMFGRYYKAEQARVCAQCIESGGPAADGCQAGPQPGNLSDCRHCGAGLQAAAASCAGFCGGAQCEVPGLV